MLHFQRITMDLFEMTQILFLNVSDLTFGATNFCFRHHQTPQLATPRASYSRLYSPQNTSPNTNGSFRIFKSKVTSDSLQALQVSASRADVSHQKMPCTEKLSITEAMGGGASCTTAMSSKASSTTTSSPKCSDFTTRFGGAYYGCCKC